MSVEEKVSQLKVTEESEQKITPWEVEGAVVDGKSMGIDYDKLISQFRYQTYH